MKNNIFKQVSRIAAMSLLLFVLLYSTACNRGGIFSDPGAQVRFSEDTVFFDTLFTEMGTATRKFKIYNPYDQTINVSKIWLAGGTSSVFRINIDGTAGTSLENIEIEAGDSIYVFANAYINPNNSNSPLVVEDSVMIQLNGSTQRVVLNAWGQDALYIGQIGYQTTFGDINDARIQVEFNNDKPIVLLGWVVYENADLNIRPGTNIHVYGGPTSRPGDRGRLYIGNNSSLNVQGTQADPVKFRSHRIDDSFFEELPFQWDGIILTSLSKNNIIRHAEIRNCVYGVYCDSLSVNSNPKLQLYNTKILNVAESGLIAINSDVYAENCLIANSSKYNLALRNGGNYDFRHCTFVNYGTGLAEHKKPVLSMFNFQGYYDTAGNLLFDEADGNISLVNCIIYGSQSKEIEFVKLDNPTKSLNWTIDHCVIKVDTLDFHVFDSYKNENPYFEDIEEFLFRPDTIISSAVDRGKIGVTGRNGQPINTDIEEISRNATPDIGAYEFF